jgi:diacylglycerol kinase (ATP)
VKNRPFRERMGFALEGIRTGWAREASFRTQTALAGVAAMVVATAPKFLAEIGW